MKKIKKKAPSEKSITPTGNPSPEWSHLAVLVAIVSAVSLLTYIPSLMNGFISNWDDNRYITENIHIRSIGLSFFKWALLDYKTNLWHPISWISHAIDYAIWGLKPFGHHLTNIIVHAVNTGIAVILSYMLLEITASTNNTAPQHSPDKRYLLVASGISGLLFGIHPLHVESVAWVTERKDLLYALFFMLSVIYYIRYARNAYTNKTPDKKPFLFDRSYLLSLGLFALSLGSKPMAITLPLICLLLDWYPLQRLTRKSIGSLIAEKIPFFALSIFVSLLTIHAQKDIGALKSIAEAPPLFRITLACKSLLLYLLKVIIPVQLLPLYPYPVDTNPFKAEYLAALTIVFVITAACLTMRRKHPFLVVTWFFFVITLLPVLGIMQAGIQSMADRFTYLASFGPLLLVSAGAACLWRRIHFSTAARTISLTTAAIVTITLLYTTLQQIAIWKDAVTLWSHMLIKYSPNYAETYHYRGQAYQKIGMLDAAINDYTQCITLAPKHVEARVNRGTAFVEKGFLDKALDDFNQVIALDPQDILVYACRGDVYAKKGLFSKAKEDFTRALSIKPINAVYINRGLIYMEEGDFTKALEDLTAAIQLQPDYPDAYPLRGDAYMKTGQAELARQDYARACSMGIRTACEKAVLPVQKEN